jgi:hypothetical protein
VPASAKVQNTALITAIPEAKACAATGPLSPLPSRAATEIAKPSVVGLSIRL